MRSGQAAILALLAVLAACSRDAPAPGALSADDERRLNEAAAMLDANAAGAADADATTANEADAND